MTSYDAFRIVFDIFLLLAESRRLEVRCGLKTKDQTRKVYVHMLNGTLCATERALCCIVENYQTPDVSRIHRCFILLCTNITTTGPRGP